VSVEAIRVEDDGAVRRLVLCRPDAYNTITPALRDELADALPVELRPHTLPGAGREPLQPRGIALRPRLAVDPPEAERDQHGLLVAHRVHAAALLGEPQPDPA
jgi:hypothetical protein